MATVETKYFPAWRYGANGATCIVQTQEEADQLGEGWYMNPGQVPAPAPPPAKTGKPGPKTKKAADVAG